MDISKNADQVELAAFLEGYATVDDGLADEKISGEIDDLILEEFGTGNSWGSEDVFLDVEEGAILKELEARLDLLGALYPFELKESSLKYSDNSEGTKIYESLLCVSLTSDRQGRTWLKLVDSFEKLSALAVRDFFQCDNVWWTGARSQDGLKKTINCIHSITKELEWHPDPNLSDLHNKIKDAGLDFITYKRFLDNRVGGLFFYGQSACGNDWFDKTRKDLNNTQTNRIFREPYARPVKLFSIPYLILNQESIMTAASNHIEGLIFDRARLTMLYADQVHVQVLEEINNVYKLAKAGC